MRNRIPSALSLLRVGLLGGIAAGAALLVVPGKSRHREELPPPATTIAEKAVGVLAPEAAAVLQTRDKLIVTVGLANPDARVLEGKLEVELKGGKAAVRGERQIRQSELASGYRFELPVPTEPAEELTLYCQFGTEHFDVPVRDVLLAKAHETSVVADRVFHPGGRAAIRCEVHAVKSLTETMPLSGADVAIRLRGEKESHTLFRGKTGANGIADARFDVPRLPEGRYSMAIETRSKQGAERLEHEVEIAGDAPTSTVADSDANKKENQAKEAVRVRLMPEGGRLVAGMWNNILISAVAANGLPADCKIWLNLRHGPMNRWPKPELRTDNAGLAQFGFVPYAENFRAGPWEPQAVERFDGSHAVLWGPRFVCDFDVEATDAQGQVVRTIAEVAAVPNGEHLRLRLGHSEFQPGQPAHAEVHATSGIDEVSLDLVRNRQTISTQQVKLQDGKADVRFQLPAEDGPFEVHAYQALASGELVRDGRAACVLGKDKRKSDAEDYRSLLGIVRPSFPDRWVVAPELERRRKAEAQIAQIGRALFQYAQDGREYMVRDPKTGPWRFRPGLLDDLVRMRYLDGGAVLDPFGGKLSLERLTQLEKHFTVERLAEAQTRFRAQQLAWALINYSNQNAARYRPNDRWEFPENALADAAKHQRLNGACRTDAWGKPFRLLAQDARRQHQMGCTQFDYHELLSAGPDGQYGTVDDVLPLSMKEWHDFRCWWLRDGARMAQLTPLPGKDRRPGDLLLHQRSGNPGPLAAPAGLLLPEGGKR